MNFVIISFFLTTMTCFKLLVVDELPLVSRLITVLDMHVLNL